jgi:hypothetical protein
VLDANPESSLRNLLKLVFSHDYHQLSRHHASAALLEAPETNRNIKSIKNKIKLTFTVTLTSSFFASSQAPRQLG